MRWRDGDGGGDTVIAMIMINTSDDVNNKYDHVEREV